MAGSILWFRRDLRLADNLALAAAESTGPVVALFVIDDRLRRPAGANRLAFLYRTLRDLDRQLGGRLVVRTGDPASVVPAVASEAGADRVVCAADFGPYGRRRDDAAAARLAAAGRVLERVGSPYAVSPGTVLKSDGTPYRVFTPYLREWTRRARQPEPTDVHTAVWRRLPSDGVPPDPDGTAELPDASEAAAHQRLDHFVDQLLDGYATSRDQPARDGTSRLSPYLKFGLLHPHQILDRVADQDGPGVERFRAELAWREFYADVLFHDPDSARRSWRPTMRRLRTDDGPEADRLFRAWAEGRTGYPLIDAGMRQLATSGWMHNRVRMIVASFLVKDLHLPWERGARHFLAHLVDGDLASNNHGWQWVAGSGTDPAPFFRVFNPVAQSLRYDPDGDYLRRFVPELRGVPAPGVHEPWRLPVLPAGYPMPIVDHGVEREEALARYAATRRAGSAGSGPSPR